MSLIEELTQLEIRARKEHASVNGAEELEALKLKYLSRKGELAVLSSRLKEVGPDEKPEEKSGSPERFETLQKEKNVYRFLRRV